MQSVTKMKVLVACEYSGRVRNAFRDRGHDAWSCDLLESEDNSSYHIQGPVDILLEEPWDLIVAHPPCTYLCNSGVRWLYPRAMGDMIEDLRVKEREEHMRDAAFFFLEIARANTPKIAIENPVMHGYARNLLVEYGIGDYGFRPDGRFNFSCHPWHFGDPAKKRTCFWTKGLPDLKPTSSMTAQDARADCHLASPGPNRWKERSRTYQGIANAMAEQWG